MKNNFRIRLSIIILALFIVIQRKLYVRIVPLPHQVLSLTVVSYQQIQILVAFPKTTANLFVRGGAQNS